MRAQILTKDELTEEDIEKFWAQDICMDDWDYIVLAPVETLEYCDYSGYEDMCVNEQCSILVQTDYTFARIMTGCCSNEWYIGKFGRHEYAIGVAYHS